MKCLNYTNAAANFERVRGVVLNCIKSLLFLYLHTTPFRLDWQMGSAGCPLQCSHGNMLKWKVKKIKVSASESHGLWPCGFLTMSSGTCHGNYQIQVWWQASWYMDIILGNNQLKPHLK